jgi:hypothetical protein
MPVDPHSWATDDFLTAALLDNDLYLYGGQYFVANGIRFHARRPIYKSYNANSGNSTASGNWCLAYGNSSNGSPASSVIVDTPGLVGAWFDPKTSGSIQLNNLLGGSGLRGLPGGLMLGISYALWPATANTGNYGAGFGNRSNASSQPFSQGTFQAANSAHQGCAICIDLVDSNSFQGAPFGLNGTGGSLSPVATTNADGSGWASRWLACWASVYTANGHTASNAPAPVTSWTSTSPTLTSTLLNGNTGLRDVLRVLNMPPLLRAEAGSSQSLTAGTDTTLNIAADSGMDSYNGFASNTYTVPFTGLYFVHGYAGINNISGRVRAGIRINSTTTYWGPFCAAPGSGGMAASKTQIFSLNAGDTIKLRASASVAATTTTTNPARLVVLYLGGLGARSPVPTPPDTTYRWAAGQPGPLDTLFNQHVANDLLFLTQRPYLLAYQATTQTGISASTPTSVTMDTVKGIVHADSGDNYNGWNAAGNKYVAPVSGWYLAVTEAFLAQPTLTSTPSVLGLLGLSPNGSDPWDRYQQQNMVTGSDGSGASAVSFYYLRAGDSIQPGVETFDSTSTTIATDVTTGINSHFEVVWLGE